MRNSTQTIAVAACLGGVLIAVGPSTTSTSLAAEEETPKQVIAVQIRRQGYTCDKPKSAERDRKASQPDEAVWVLECENATYRIRLIPDMAADVTKIQ